MTEDIRKKTIAFDGVIGFLPTALALASALTFVLSFVYQWAYFGARGSEVGLANVSFSDLVDHAGVPSFAAFAMFLFSLILVRLLPRAAVEQAQKKKRYYGGGALLLLFLMTLAAVSSYRGGWTRLTGINAASTLVMFILGFLSTGVFFSALGSFRVQVAISIVAASVLMPVCIGATKGAADYLCPTPVELTLTNGSSIEGELIANLNKVVVFSDSRTAKTIVVPWTQIARLSEGECKSINGKK